jgi:hypothetical protein
MKDPSVPGCEVCGLVGSGPWVGICPACHVKARTTDHWNRMKTPQADRSDWSGRPIHAGSVRTSWRAAWGPSWAILWRKVGENV